MNRMSLPGSAVGVRRRMRRFVHGPSHRGARDAELTSIRFATAVGCFCVFALLCMLSIRANAAPLTDGRPYAMQIDDRRPAVALGAHNATVHPGQAVEGDPPNDGTGTSFAPASHHSRDASSGQPALAAYDAAAGQPTWLLTLAAAAVVALVGACLSRAVLRRMAGKRKHIVDGWARRCKAAEARERAAQPFAVEQWKPSAEPARGNGQAPLFSSAAQPWDASASASFEPFESRYLDSLSEEGIDLQTFLNTWRDAMDDDLKRLSVLRREGDSDHLHSVLHRLSGAVGLVGARSLMEALRRASTSPLEHDASAIDALMERARTLVTQLEATSRAYRSAPR